MGQHEISLLRCLNRVQLIVNELNAIHISFHNSFNEISQSSIFLRKVQGMRSFSGKRHFRENYRERGIFLL